MKYHHGIANVFFKHSRMIHQPDIGNVIGSKEIYVPLNDEFTHFSQFQEKIKLAAEWMKVAFSHKRMMSDDKVFFLGGD